MPIRRLPVLAAALIATLTAVPGPEAAPARGRGAMSGELRLLLRSLPPASAGARQGAAVASVEPLELQSGLAGRFALSRGPAGTSALFRAILDRGDDGEIQALEAAGARIRGHIGRVATFQAPLALAPELAALPAVRYLDLGRSMRPELDASRPDTGSDLVADPVSGYGGAGAGVLVAVIDTGQDVKHKDFRKLDKSTRFKSVWNMDPFCKGSPPPGHFGGCYYQEERINKHLKGKKGLKYKDPGVTGGHGSHVMGIAAGNGLDARKRYPTGVYVGMAPEADLIGVKVFDDDGFFVGDVTEALQFLGEEQARLGNPPLVVNLSVGHQLGAHDGTDPDELAIDAFVQDGATAGTPRVVVKSAGNDGGSGIYLTGSLDAPSVHPVTNPLQNSSGDFCGAFSGRGNDYFVASLWYPGDTTVEVTVSAPGGVLSFTNQTGNDPNDAWTDTGFGTLFVDCPADAHPVSGDRQCVLGVDDTGGVAPAVGTWTVGVSRVSGPTGGKFDSWVLGGDVGICTLSWDSPSPGGTITIPGTSQEVITVGAHVTKTQWIDFRGNQRMYVSSLNLVKGDLAFFSGEGPTRDGRIKPDLTAPGMGIASSRSRKVSIAKGTDARLRTVEDKKHFVLEGTSMAAPHVAGAVAQLLSLDPALDAATIRSLLASNASTDAFTGGALPDNTWGAGKLDVFGAASDHLGPP